MDPKLLRKWQHFRVDCNYRNELKGLRGEYKGTWCNKKDTYCKFDICEEYLGGSPKKTERTLRGLSERHKKAFDWNEKGKSLSWISKKLKVSKSTVHSWIKKYKAFINGDKGVGYPNDKPVSRKLNDLSSGKHLKRLHNDSVSFLISPIDLSMERDVVRLKYDKYKLLRFPGLHIQIFSRKLVVRFLDDIEAVSVRECKRLAELRIFNFLKGFSYEGIKFLGDGYEQVSRHYAIIGTGLARKVIREKRKFFVLDRVDGRKRLEVDYSKGVPETEFPHPVKSDGDVVMGERFFDVLLDKPGSYDTLDVTKYKVDNMMRAVELFARESGVYAKNIKNHNASIDDLRFGIKQMTRVVNDLRKEVKRLGGGVNGKG